MYVMSWSELGAFYTCGGGSVASSDPHGPGGLPGPKEKGLPGSVAREDPAFWPESSAGVREGPGGTAPTAAAMGQVSSVARAGDGTAWVLRRGPRSWGPSSFSGPDGRHFNHAEAIPGDDALLMRIDQDTGEVLQKCGAGLFWMPHMASPTRDGSVWVTDAGAHTATKLSRDCAVLAKLGTPGAPGTGGNNFCKPTRAVELGDGGDVLVADGYCNARVARFNKAGEFQGEYDLVAHEAMFPAPGVRRETFFEFFLPHLFFVAARRRKKLEVKEKNSPPFPPLLPLPSSLVYPTSFPKPKNRRKCTRMSPTTSPSTNA